MLDLEILPDGVEGVHLLTLVLVHALDLDVEDRVRVNLDVLLGAQPRRQAPLVALLDLQEPLDKAGVTAQGEKVLQLGGVADPPVADGVGHQRGQRRVAAHEPAAEGDAVGLVGELLGVELGEGPHLGLNENLRVKRGHPVDGVAEVHVHRGHVHDVVAVDHRDGRVLGARAGERVKLADDGHDAGRHLLDVAHRPGLERLCEDGVVGVAAGALHDGGGVLERDAALHEQAHQLGDDHRGMGVVDVHGHVAVELLGRVSAILELGEDELRPGGDHEVLLVDAQEAAGLVGVVRVEEAREAVADVALVKGDAALGGRRGLLHVKEVQPVDHAVLKARHLDVVHVRRERAKAKGDREGRACVDQPGLGLDPGVGLLALDAFGEVLPKEAVVVVEAHAVAGQPERGDGVEEARGEPAQAAVAERGLGLAVLHGGERGAVGGKDALDLVCQAEVHKVGAQQAAHQELGGEVVELAVARGGGHPRLEVAHRAKQGAEDLRVRGVVERGAHLGERLTQVLLDVHRYSPSHCRVVPKCGSGTVPFS